MRTTIVAHLGISLWLRFEIQAFSIRIDYYSKSVEFRFSFNWHHNPFCIRNKNWICGQDFFGFVAFQNKTVRFVARIFQDVTFQKKTGHFVARIFFTNSERRI